MNITAPARPRHPIANRPIGARRVSEGPIPPMQTRRVSEQRPPTSHAPSPARPQRSTCVLLSPHSPDRFSDKTPPPQQKPRENRPKERRVSCQKPLHRGGSRPCWSPGTGHQTPASGHLRDKTPRLLTAPTTRAAQPATADRRRVGVAQRQRRSVAATIVPPRVAICEEKLGERKARRRAPHIPARSLGEAAEKQLRGTQTPRSPATPPGERRHADLQEHAPLAG
ncbi:hypothetical protein Pla175_36000 [Pirellulimonas nuda]|uniref:Uncharacterized protein n=1 Tax=Pirellulimonas nuda TaxID=2528009 RepID=A0A518DFG4_9BACT|nr:hypothetical protein Pla175_36000 [Pirellulimonas nuda]